MTMQFDFDVEGAAIYLSGAIKTFYIIRGEMESNLLAMDRTGLNFGAGHLLDCCDALGTVLRELDRINDEMGAAVDAAYTKKRGCDHG